MQKSNYFFPSIGFSIRLSLAAGLAYFVGYYLTDWDKTIPQEIGGLWSVISAVLVLRLTNTEMLHASIDRVFGTLIGSVISAFYLLFTDNIWFFPVAILIASLICHRIKPLKDSLFGATLAIVVILIVWQMSPQKSPWIFCLARFAESFIGVLISLIIFYSHHVTPKDSNENLDPP